MIRASIIREPDDPTAQTRISLGQPVGTEDFYLVFRGDPDKNVALLEMALTAAILALPAGQYEDRR